MNNSIGYFCDGGNIKSTPSLKGLESDKMLLGPMGIHNRCKPQKLSATQQHGALFQPKLPNATNPFV